MGGRTFQWEGALSFSSHGVSGFKKHPNSFIELLAYLLDSKHLCEEIHQTICINKCCTIEAGCQNGFSPFSNPDIPSSWIPPDFVFIRADRIFTGVPIMLDAITLLFLINVTTIILLFNLILREISNLY